MKTLETPLEIVIAGLNLNRVPVVSTDRHIFRKEQARLARTLFKDLGLKGISVTCPNYSMAQSVDVRVPRATVDDSDWIVDGKTWSPMHYSMADMPEETPARVMSRNHQNAKAKLHEILNRAFPNHDDRSDSQSDHFDYKWSVD